MTKQDKLLGDRSIVINSTENKAEVKMDVDELAKSMESEMACNMSMPLNCSIFQVPTILSRHNPTSYAPGQFSIGPFHHQNETLRRTEPIKWKYLRDLLSRHSKYYPDKNLLSDLSSAMSDSQEEAWEHYAGAIGLEPSEFVKLLVLDGCFIVELFRKKAYKSIQTNDDPILSMSCLRQFLLHDLILLENQIPWMVLEKLFDLTMVKDIDEKPLAEIAVEFFGAIFSTKAAPHLDKDLLIKLKGSKHILDLLRCLLISPFNYAKLKDTDHCDSVASMQSATSLNASGIKFRQRKSTSILDLKFCKKTGVFEIPQLFIQETTETVFRNLIALEQCCPNYDSVVTCYAVLLDNLINTRADMEVLCKSGAVETWLNVDDASKFFEKLYIGTYIKEGFYLGLTRDVREYCKKPCHRYMRILRSQYFSHPWAFISFVAASFVLILTFLQTFYTMKGTDKKKL